MVVFFDIDGTIIDEKTQQIPQSAIDAVATLTERGHIPVINTGRPYCHIDPRVRQMAFPAWVCGCGMEVLYQGNWLSRQHPGDDVCTFVIRRARECGMLTLYEAQEGAIVLDGSYALHPAIQLEKTRMAAKGFRIYTVEEHPRFMKFLTWDAPGCRRQEFLKDMEPYFSPIDRGNTAVEYVTKGCSKAGGMELLLKALGVSREDTLAIGDSTNDLPMFRTAGHTVCMGGGMAELKAVSDYITAPVMEDGIAKALKHFGLLG